MIARGTLAEDAVQNGKKRCAHPFEADRCLNFNLGVFYRHFQIIP